MSSNLLYTSVHRLLTTRPTTRAASFISSRFFNDSPLTLHSTLQRLPTLINRSFQPIHSYHSTSLQQQHERNCSCCTSKSHHLHQPASSSTFCLSRPFSTYEAVPGMAGLADCTTGAPATSSNNSTAEGQALKAPSGQLRRIIGDLTPSEHHKLQDRMLMLYTCTVCNTRAAKSVGKHAYHNGVVLVRCDGCQKLHLFADHLGWFEDKRITIEDIMAEKGEKVERSSLTLKDVSSSNPDTDASSSKSS